MPELGTSGSVGGPGWATTQVYPPALDLACQSPEPGATETFFRWRSGATEMQEDLEAEPYAGVWQRTIRAWGR